MFSFLDAARLVLAALTFGVAVALPGVIVARVVGLARERAVVVGLAVLPLVDSLVTRLFGLDAALVLTLALAAGGAVALMRAALAGEVPKASIETKFLCLVWLIIVIAECGDFDIAGRLYQPFTVIDMVKHAATTQAIVTSGAPPHDPFFLRPQRVSYYYFFYTLTALTERLGLGCLDARAAVGGSVFWVGVGLYGLVGLASERIGLGRAKSRLLVIAVLAAGGLDILGVLRMGLLQGQWLPDPAFWNEQVTGWLESLLWVPHHVTGLIAGMLGLMALAGLAKPVDPAEPVGLAEPVDLPSRIEIVRGVGLAAICFASALGLSVWLTLGLVTTVALWVIVLVAERRWRLCAYLVAAGGFAVLLSAPQIVDLVVGRAGGGPSPIVATVRAFTPVDGLIPEGPWRYLGRLFALPLNYFAGFGVLAAGALLYRRQRADTAARNFEFGRVLWIAAVAGLALGGFLKSTLFNNDLGWRVVELPLLAATVWTIAALDRLPGRPWLPLSRGIPATIVLLFGLGWATNLYALVELRAYPWLADDPDVAFMSADPATERALRVAYAWADAHLPKNAVLQHDPTRQRAFAFALYGRHQTAVGDDFGSLYGADPRAVDARIAALAPLFRASLPGDEVRSVALANGIADIVVTAADPVWSKRGAALMTARPVYASARVRIVPVADLGNPTTRPSPEAAAPGTEARL